MNKIQTDLAMTWAKIKLNCFYDFLSIPVISMEYDENKALQITEEGKKNLMAIVKSMKNEKV